jgi:murein DD-endopeptidase MepM/ murein hydrolase activator NlpD
MPRKGFSVRARAFFKRLFHARNVIVVSAHKVDHIPVSGGMQLLIALGVLGCFSVVSYLAGGYAAARHQVAVKERKLAASEMEKNLMGQDFALLKRDLMKIRSNGKELSEYSKFILNQYAEKTNGRMTPESAAKMRQVALSKAGDGKLFDRIQYLEKRINEITAENSQLLYAIRERTEGKIDLFEDIISTTGLNEGALEHSEAERPAKTVRLGSAVKAAATPVAANVPQAGAPAGNAVAGEGGPFIPFDSSMLTADDKALLGDIERLVRLNDIIETLPLGMPIRNFQESGGFGARVDPFNHMIAFHPGLDMAGPFGSHIFAANDGVVITASRYGSYGNMVDIDHGLGLSTRYAHLSKILVHVGEHVKKGQLIALEGSTGRSTGPHLHYEVRYNDRPIDPKKFLTARNLYVSQEQ